MNYDNQSLHTVSDRRGSPIRHYDDGSGPLWLYRDAGGLVGVVRAQTWHEAWDLVEDEILKPIPEDEVIEAYGFFVVAHPWHEPTEWLACRDTNFHEEPCELGVFDSEKATREAIESILSAGEYGLIEGYSYQSNATGSGIVPRDLNGEYLEPLTSELARELGLILVWENEE